MADNDAPGLKRRRRSDETFALYWVASAVSRRAKSYPLKTIRLCDDETLAAAKCHQLTAELLEWIDGNEGPKTAFDGTIDSLIGCYTTDPYSPYRAVKANTRRQYDESLRIIRAEVGTRRIDRVTRADFMRWHRGFRFPDGDGVDAKGNPKPDRLRRAHHCMKLVRILVHYGASMRYAGCRDAADILSDIKFPLPRRRDEQLSYEQAAAIVEAAIAAGRASIALGQALQFELTLRQKDVVGEWFYEPASNAAIATHGWRWANGVLWSDVSADGILTKQTTKTAAIGRWRLSNYPLVVRALEAYPPEKRVGPMIVSETTRLPYRADDYRIKWRAIADKAGVPKKVWNMDSRAGGITEGDEAGADLRDLAHHATHADTKTTSRYVRETQKATARVATLRVASRKKEADG